MPPNAKAEGYILTESPLLIEQTFLLATLGKCKKVTIIKDEKDLPKGCGAAIYKTNKIFLDLGSHIDFKKETERLNKKLNELLAFKEKLQIKMDGKNRDKIPQKVKD